MTIGQEQLDSIRKKAPRFCGLWGLSTLDILIDALELAQAENTRLRAALTDIDTKMEWSAVSKWTPRAMAEYVHGLVADALAVVASESSTPR